MLITSEMKKSIYPINLISTEYSVVNNQYSVPIYTYDFGENEEDFDFIIGSVNNPVSISCRAFSVPYSTIRQYKGMGIRCDNMKLIKKLQLLNDKLQENILQTYDNDNIIFDPIVISESDPTFEQYYSNECHNTTPLIRIKNIYLTNGVIDDRQYGVYRLRMNNVVNGCFVTSEKTIVFKLGLDIIEFQKTHTMVSGKLIPLKFSKNALLERLERSEAATMALRETLTTMYSLDIPKE